ncbi:SgcJ/EcaC family oxidoreductase [Williamsia sp. CHRR-6]|uniref:SgcJ/EcaC family oxidoreductase n=1 Tax=Williamsia sp. CHRR-6 TaxID=2835871 RepID=UPI001BDAFA3F|nr:SgcJ/EcaC family oxidoreductase [Williamsia sp. CHRR-6]MBT0567612.1 SgcJ/EcaC family oxidoreductase [Williamsia sp. CHRR-6]
MGVDRGSAVNDNDSGDFMNSLKRAVAAALATGAVLAGMAGVAAPASAAPHHAPGKPGGYKQGPLASKAEIAALFDRWNAALATLNPDRVADEYAPGAILLPTVSNTPRIDRAGIRAYFANEFLPSKPQGKIVSEYIDVYDSNSAGNSGIYDFTLTNKDGSKSVVRARFSFFYEKINGKWLIETQHSSKLPEPETK